MGTKGVSYNNLPYTRLKVYDTILLGYDSNLPGARLCISSFLQCRLDSSFMNEQIRRVNGKSTVSSYLRHPTPVFRHPYWGNPYVYDQSRSSPGTSPAKGIYGLDRSAPTILGKGDPGSFHNYGNSLSGEKEEDL